MYCSVLQHPRRCRASQCVAACCSVSQQFVASKALQRVAACRSVLQRVAACCSVLQCVAVCCSVLQCVAVCRSALQRIAVCRSVSQHPKRCSLLQRDAAYTCPCIVGSEETGRVAGVSGATRDGPRTQKYMVLYTTCTEIHDNIYATIHKYIYV